MEPNQVQFYPPPGWSPLLGGRVPPASWSPDPGLPPAPIGWVFYRDSLGAPAMAPLGAWSPTPPTVPRASRVGKGIILLGCVLGVALVVVAAFVLGPRQTDLSTAQFAKIVDSGEIAGHLVAGDPYVDAPSATPNDPEGLASCDVYNAFAQKHILRVWSGKAADGASLWIELWDSPDSIKTVYEVEEKCEADRNALTASKYLRMHRLYLRTQGALTRSYSRSVDIQGYVGFTAGTSNVRAGGICKGECATEAYSLDFADKFEIAVQAARRS